MTPNEPITNEAIAAMIERLDDAHNNPAFFALINEAAEMFTALLAEREWMPIAEYDAMPHKKRPALAMFRFAATQPSRPGGAFLAETFRNERNIGFRECTDYFTIPLPAPPEKA
jgi:hypothetical protein